MPGKEARSPSPAPVGLSPSSGGPPTAQPLGLGCSDTSFLAGNIICACKYTTVLEVSLNASLF